MGLRGNYPLGTGPNNGADDGHQHGAAPMANAGLAHLPNALGIFTF